MTVVLSLLAAASWGSGDFFGGVASRHGRATAVAATSQLVGIAAVLVLAPFVGGSPTWADVVWGGLAGLSGGIGVLSLYRGMAVADLGAVAPTAAIGTAAFPLLFAFVIGERPGALELSGLLLCIVALWLISSRKGGSGSGHVTGLLYGLGAGAGFGFLLVGLSRIGEDAGIWPLAPTRVAGAVIIAAIAIGTKQALRPLAASWRAIVPAATLGILGNTFFLFASQEGSLAVAAVLGSLFPAATVGLARLVMKETLTSRRAFGLAVAVVAVAMISAG